MTEPEWLAATDPTEMGHRLGETISLRKWRLVLLACCRTVPDLDARIIGPAFRAAESHTEQVMNGDEAASWRDNMREMKEQWVMGQEFEHAALARRVEMIFSEAAVVKTHHLFHNMISWMMDSHNSNRIVCSIIRDIFNPFHSGVPDPSWRTSTVVSLARTMYDSRDFTTMPMLADALEDAGCRHADILNHCRGDGTHIRGCWVVDLALGRS